MRSQGCSETGQETCLIGGADAFCWQVAHPFTLVSRSISIPGHHRYERATALIADIPWWAE